MKRQRRCSCQIPRLSTLRGLTRGILQAPKTFSTWRVTCETIVLCFLKLPKVTLYEVLAPINFLARTYGTKMSLSQIPVSREERQDISRSQSTQAYFCFSFSLKRTICVR